MSNTREILDPHGRAIRTETHQLKLEMLMQWLGDERVLEAAVRPRGVATVEDIAALGARVGATLAMPEAGTWRMPGVDEADAGRFLFLLLDDRNTRAAVAGHVERRYGVKFKAALRELRTMWRELEAEQPPDEEPFLDTSLEDALIEDEEKGAVH